MGIDAGGRQGWTDDSDFTEWPVDALSSPEAVGQDATSGPAWPIEDITALTDEDVAGEMSGSKVSHPARLALGVVLLAADRVRVRAPSDSFVVGVGLAQQTVDEMRHLARRALRPPGTAASRAIDWASRRTGVRTNSGLLGRTRERVGRVVSEARNAGRATIAAGREDASAFVRSSVADGMAWAESQAVPRIVDSLVPHLVESVVPRLINGVMPEIRASVLPAVLDDLTKDPRVRELVTEQSRDVIGEAAQAVRSASATADSRVEMAFQRLIGAGPTPADPRNAEPAGSHDG